jgi:hypothetical protein
MNIVSSLLAAGLLLATASAIAQTAQQPRVVRTSSTYSCGASPQGECAFLLYTSDCREGEARNGAPSLVCTHALFARFTLKPGESKHFADLPPGVKQCQAQNGKLVFPDCMRN